MQISKLSPNSSLILFRALSTKVVFFRGVIEAQKVAESCSQNKTCKSCEPTFLHRSNYICLDFSGSEFYSSEVLYKWFTAKSSIICYLGVLLAHSRLPCYVFCICLLTYRVNNRYQKYKSVELAHCMSFRQKDSACLAP